MAPVVVMRWVLGILALASLTVAGSVAAQELGAPAPPEAPEPASPEAPEPTSAGAPEPASPGPTAEPFAQPVEPATAEAASPTLSQAWVQPPSEHAPLDFATPIPFLPFAAVPAAEPALAPGAEEPLTSCLDTAVAASAHESASSSSSGPAAGPLAAPSAPEAANGLGGALIGFVLGTAVWGTARSMGGPRHVGRVAPVEARPAEAREPATRREDLAAFAVRAREDPFDLDAAFSLGVALAEHGHGKLGVRYLDRVIHARPEFLLILLTDPRLEQARQNSHVYRYLARVERDLQARIMTGYV